MIRRYLCPRCKVKRNFYHTAWMDEGQVRYFRCADCGHIRTVMDYAARERLDESPWQVEDVDVFKSVEKIR